MLPSEVIVKANTFDMFICNAAMTYIEKLKATAMNKNKQPKDYTQEELLEMVAQTRGKSQS